MRSYLKTPLIKHHSMPQILMKAENLQPFGSYKIRGVQHFFEKRLVELQERGIVVASAGNMAQAVAHFSKVYKIDCTIYIPESAPRKKKKALQELKARIIEKPFIDIWEMVSKGHQGGECFLHPALTDELTEGYGSLVREILDEDKDIDAIVVPFGVGGLTLGVLNAVTQSATGVQVYAAEIDGAAPLLAALEAGQSVEVERKPSFVDAIGTPQLIPKVFERLKGRISDSIVVSEREAAIQIPDLLNQHSMLIEGAAAVGLAASKKLVNQGRAQKVCTILTGGNIDLNSLVGSRTPSSRGVL